MKWLFSLLLPFQVNAIESVIVYYPQTIINKEVVEKVIDKNFYLPATFISYRAIEKSCTKNSESVLTICILEKPNTKELELNILNVDWDFWRRNREIFIKEII